MTALSDRVAIVTGASGALGGAVAVRLAADGARCVRTDRDPSALDAAASRLREAMGQDDLATVACDIANEASCRQLVDAAVARFGRIDAIVHAGHAGPASQPLHTTGDDDYDRIVGRNLRGAFLLDRAVAKQMVTARSGDIVHVVSEPATDGPALWNAAQAGIVGFAESLAAELGPMGIRVQVLVLEHQPEDAVTSPTAASQARPVAEAVALCLGLPADVGCRTVVLSTCGRGGRRRLRSSAAE